MLDRVFALHPGGLENPAETIWGKQLPSPALATVAEPLEEGGRVYRPASAMTVRMRYRTDIGTHARLIDQEGRVWRYMESAEVGRRHWLDVSLVTYGLPEPSRAHSVAPPVPAAEHPGDPAWVPPPGWLLQWRAGAGHTDIFDPPRYVRELVVNGTHSEGDWLLFDVVIPSPGWAVAPGVRQWFRNAETAGQLDRVRASSDRVPISHIYVLRHGGGLIDPVAAVDANELREGSTFPARDGAFGVLAGEAAGDALVIGDTVRIVGPGG